MLPFTISYIVFRPIPLRPPVSSPNAISHSHPRVTFPLYTRYYTATLTIGPPLDLRPVRSLWDTKLSLPLKSDLVPTRTTLFEVTGHHSYFTLVFTMYESGPGTEYLSKVFLNLQYVCRPESFVRLKITRPGITVEY